METIHTRPSIPIKNLTTQLLIKFQQNKSVTLEAFSETSTEIETTGGNDRILQNNI